MRKTVTILLALAAAACSRMPAAHLSAYRIEIQQGNFVTQEMAAQLKPGMTKDQVRFVLGTPLVADIFHADRWDYMFTRMRVNSRELEERRITVFFEDGRLVRVEGDVVAAANAQKKSAGEAEQQKTAEGGEGKAAVPSEQQ